MSGPSLHIAWMCSLYLVLNVLPTWPMYFFRNSNEFSWQMSLLLKTSPVVFDGFGHSTRLFLYAMFISAWLNNLAIDLFVS